MSSEAVDSCSSPLPTFRQRWLAYKEVMEGNMQQFVDALRIPNLWTLRRNLTVESAKGTLCDVESEFAFCHLDAENSTKEKDAVSNFVKCLIFRPDVSCAVERLLRVELHLTVAATLLREAINAAEWTETFWSSISGLPEVELEGWTLAVRSTGDALAGTATVSLKDLQNDRIVSLESGARIMDFVEFSERRGVKLATTLVATDWQSVKNVFARNRFLQLVLAAACDGEWCGPTEYCNLPPIPDYYIFRTSLIDEAHAALLEALRSPDQQWVVISGTAGAGKTCLAIDLAHRNLAARVVWLSFGQRSKAEIYAEARTAVLDSFPDADRTLLTPETCLTRTLTREATKGVILFLDDVCGTDVLKCFAEAETVVITSRMRIKYHRVKNVANVSVPPSLTVQESLQIFGKIVERDVSSFLEILMQILESLRFNALATSALASYLQAHESEWDNNFLQEMLNKMKKDKEDEFGTISETLESSGHDYSESGHTDVNVYCILNIFIEDLRSSSKDAYYSLIVFPRGAMISNKVFARINGNAQRLINFCERSLLQRRGGEKFAMHDLFRDVIENQLNRNWDVRKSYFKRVVDVYETDNEIDPEDDFFFLNFINVCLEAQEVGVAERRLVCPNYLLDRFLKLGFTNLLSDFDNVVELHGNEDVNAVRNFFSHPDFWKRIKDRKSILRQTVLFDREGVFFVEMLRLARKETQLPLFQAELHTFEEKPVLVEETARIEFEDYIVDLAVRADDSSALVVTEKELILFIPNQMMCSRRSFDEKVMTCAPSQGGQWLLVTVDGCVLIDNELEDAKRWSPGWRIEESAVSPDGSHAVAWAAGESLLVFRAQLGDGKMFSGSEERNVRGLAVSTTHVAIVCSVEHEMTDLLIGTIAEGKINRTFNISFTVVRHVPCAFFSNDELVIFNERLMHLFNLISGESTSERIDRTKVFASDQKFNIGDNKKTGWIHFRTHLFPLLCIDTYFPCMDGDFIRDARFYIYHSLCKMLKTEFSFILSNGDRQIVWLKPTARKLSLPRPVFNRNCCKVKWLPQIEDFAFFFPGEKKTTIKAARNGVLNEFDFFRFFPHKARVTINKDRAIVWTHGSKGVMDVCLENSPSNWLIRFCTPQRLGQWYRTEDITAVAVSDSLLAVSTGCKKILLRSGSEWKTVVEVTENVVKMFAFSNTLGVLFEKLRELTFKIIDCNGDEKFKQTEVRSAKLSPCNQKAALVLRSGIVLEVSDWGVEMRRFDLVNCVGVRFLSDAILAWSSDGRAVILREGQRQELQIPKDVLKMKKAREGSLAVMLNKDDQLWLQDLVTGDLELVFDFYCSGFHYFIKNFYLSPDASFIVIKGKENHVVVINRFVGC